jgi:hypothetical protein
MDGYPDSNADHVDFLVTFLGYTLGADVLGCEKSISHCIFY